jgi:protein TonB
VKDDPGKTITSDQGVGQGTSPPSVFVAAQAVIGTHTTPDYPPLETRLGHEGNVYLHLAIDANGVVADVRIVRSSGYDDLDQAAADWVKAHWRYLPATQGGVPTASSTDAIVTFRLTTR